MQRGKLKQQLLEGKRTRIGGQPEARKQKKKLQAPAGDKGQKKKR